MNRNLKMPYCFRHRKRVKIVQDICIDRLFIRLHRNKTDHHDITEILLKVVFSTITLPNPLVYIIFEHIIGLEAQFLGIVVKKEKTELEETKDQLVKSIASGKKKLEECEDEILRLVKKNGGT